MKCTLLFQWCPPQLTSLPPPSSHYFALLFIPFLLQPPLSPLPLSQIHSIPPPYAGCHGTFSCALALSPCPTPSYSRPLLRHPCCLILLTSLGYGVGSCTSSRDSSPLETLHPGTLSHWLTLHSVGTSIWSPASPESLTPCRMSWRSQGSLEMGQRAGEPALPLHLTLAPNATTLVTPPIKPGLQQHCPIHAYS